MLTNILLNLCKDGDTGTIGIKATLDISEMQRNVQKYVQNIDMMQDHTDTASQSVARSFLADEGCRYGFLIY